MKSTNVQNFYISNFNWEFQFAYFGVPISYSEIQKKQIGTPNLKFEAYKFWTLVRASVNEIHLDLAVSKVFARYSPTFEMLALSKQLVRPAFSYDNFKICENIRNRPQCISS